MEFYTEEQVKEMLKLGTKQCHALMQTEGFPSIKVGREYRVLRSSLEEWASSTKEIRLNYEHVS